MVAAQQQGAPAEAHADGNDHGHVHQHPTGPDLVGQVLSAICAVHCVVTPIVLALLPAAASFLGGFHPVLLLLVIGVGLWAFVPGYRAHRNVGVLALALLGVTLLAVAALVLHGNLVADTAVSFCGAVVMMTAHWRNRTLQKRCTAVHAQ